VNRSTAPIAEYRKLVLKLFEKNSAIEFVHVIAARNPAGAQLSGNVQNGEPLYLSVVLTHIHCVG